MPPKRSHYQQVADSKTIYGTNVHWFEWVIPPTSTDEDIAELRSKGQGGWVVTEHGCLLPILYCNNGELSKVRRALGLGQGELSYQAYSGPVVNTSWPTQQQQSSLCHLHICCNPYHFRIEEQWVNLRRNYCRGNINGHHDCNMEPNCYSPFSTSPVKIEDMSNIQYYLGLYNHAAISLSSYSGTFPNFTSTFDPDVKYKHEFTKNKARKLGRETRLRDMTIS